MSDLPTGTVTFLFTDIEGSTPLWERLPQAMRAALARHNAILDKAILDHGGQVYQVVGDGFSAAFPHPGQAVEAAVAAQRLLQAENWGETGPLKVRMGIHTAPAEVRGGGYAVSHDLNRVARIMSAGHGGQILLSREAAELNCEQLPGEIRLRDLGDHQLKGMARPEHLYQVLSPGLPDEFPPPASENKLWRRLPEPTTPVVGREREIRELGELLLGKDARLITLTGPGGTGKTRLALEIAHRMIAHYRHGSFFVSLAPINDPQLLPAAIARELDIKESGKPILETLKGALSGRELLLVLDNFEHLMGAAPTVSELLAVAPGLQVLATSRERLRLRGEHLYPVSPLAVPPPGRMKAGIAPEDAYAFSAIELFCKRAKAAWPSFVLNASNTAVVGEICARLDGLPLAIELAAARLALFGTPEALLERLGSGLKLLRGGSRDLPERQQTLEATIWWSYSLLLLEEQQLFRRLAVFSGGCTLETAEAVLNRDGDLGLDVLDGIEALVNKSLLRLEMAGAQRRWLDDEPRFVMLQMIREFANERLEESGEAEKMRLYHAGVFRDLVETAEPQLAGPEQGRWLERVEAEQDNLRTALDWSRSADQRELAMRLSAALAWFWQVRGHYSEGRRYLEAVLSRQQENADPSLLARVLYGAAISAFAQADYGAARCQYEEALEISEKAGYQEGVIRALGGLGDVAGYQGDYTGSRAYFERSLEIAEESGDKSGTARSLAGLGGAAADHGEYASARSFFERSLAAAEEIGDLRQIARALNGLGYVASDQGDPELARSYFERSLAIGEAIGDRGRIAVTLGNLGAVAADLSDFSAARSYNKRSLAVAEEIGDKSVAGIALVNLSEIEFNQGDFTAAFAYSERGRAIAGETAEKRMAAITLFMTGEIDRVRGDYSAARASLEHGFAIAEEIGDMRQVALALNSLGVLTLYQGDPAGARSYHERSLKVAEEIGEKRVSAIALTGLGAAAAYQDDWANARSYLRRSLELAGEIGDQRQIALALSSLGEVDRQQGDDRLARSNLERSLAIEKEVGDKRTAAEVLRKLATLAAGSGAFDRAARLWGASERLRIEIGAAIPPIDQAGEEGFLDDVRAKLGEDGFAAMAAEGGAMGVEEAIAYVFEGQKAAKVTNL